MRRLTKAYLLMAVLLAVIGWYQWNYYHGILCEPCLPEGPCPICPAVYATPIAQAIAGVEVLLLLAWLVVWCKRNW